MIDDAETMWKFFSIPPMSKLLKRKAWRNLALTYYTVTVRKPPRHHPHPVQMAPSPPEIRVLRPGCPAPVPPRRQLPPRTTCTLSSPAPSWACAPRPQPPHVHHDFRLDRGHGQSQVLLDLGPVQSVPAPEVVVRRRPFLRSPYPAWLYRNRLS